MGMIISAEDPMFDFASLEASFDAIDYTIKELKYDGELDGANIIFANSRRPIGRTLGREKCTGSMTMYLAEANRFLRALGPGFKLRTFPVVSKFSVPGVDIAVDTLIACRITKVSGGGSEGGDPMVREFTLQPTAILWNGLDPLGEALTLG
jgi:hypothetical protein